MGNCAANKEKKNDLKEFKHHVIQMGWNIDHGGGLFLIFHCWEKSDDQRFVTYTTTFKVSSCTQNEVPVTVDFLQLELWRVHVVAVAKVPRVFICICRKDVC